MKDKSVTSGVPQSHSSEPSIIPLPQMLSYDYKENVRSIVTPRSISGTHQVLKK